jgi:hypothetical protein
MKRHVRQTSFSSLKERLTGSYFSKSYLEE